MELLCLKIRNESETKYDIVIVSPDDKAISSFSMAQTNKLRELIEKIMKTIIGKGFIDAKHNLLFSSPSKSAKQYDAKDYFQWSLLDLFKAVLKFNKNEEGYFLMIHIEPKLFLTLKNSEVILSNNDNRPNNAIEVKGLHMKDSIRVLLNQIIKRFFKGRHWRKCYYCKQNSSNPPCEILLSIRSHSINYLFPCFTEEYEYALAFEFNEDRLNRKRTVKINKANQNKRANHLNQLFKSMPFNDYHFFANDNNYKAISIITGRKWSENEEKNNNDNTIALSITKSMRNTLSVTFTNYQSMKLFQFDSRMFNQIEVLELKYHFESIHNKISYAKVKHQLNRIAKHLSSNIDLRLEFNCAFKDKPMDTQAETSNDHLLASFNLESLSLADSLCLLSSTTNLRNLGTFISSFPCHMGLKLSVQGFKFNSNKNLRLLMDVILNHRISHYSMANSYIEILDNEDHELQTIFEFDFSGNIYMRLNDHVHQTSKIIKLDNLQSFELKNTPLAHISVNANCNWMLNKSSIRKVSIDSQSIMNKESLLVKSFSLLRTPTNYFNINDDIYCETKNAKLAIECIAIDETIEQLEKDDIEFPNSITSLKFRYSDLSYKYMPRIKDALARVNTVSFNTCKSLFVLNTLKLLYQRNDFPNSIEFVGINDAPLELNQKLNPNLSQCTKLKIKDSFVYCTDLAVEYLSLTFYSIKELAEIEGVDYDHYLQSIGGLVIKAKKEIKLKGNALNILLQYLSSNQNKPKIIIKNASIEGISQAELETIVKHSSKVLLLNVVEIPLSFCMRNKVEIDYLSLNYALFKEADLFYDYYDMKAKMISAIGKETKNKEDYLSMYNKAKQNVSNLVNTFDDKKSKLVVYYYNQRQFASVINMFSLTKNEETVASNLNQDNIQPQQDATTANNDAGTNNNNNKPTVKQKVNWSYFISNNQREFFNENSIIDLLKFNKSKEAKGNQGSNSLSN